MYSLQKLALISLIFIFYGCNPNKPYREWTRKIDPNTKKTSIGFFVKSHNPEGTFFHIHEGNACVSTTDIETIEESSENYFGVVRFSRSEAKGIDNIKTTEIPAGKEITILMSSNKSQSAGYNRIQKSSCQFAISWIPEESKEYMIGYTWEYNKCKTAIFENSENKRPIQVENAKLYRYYQNSCTPL